ncbi:hypothetical protein BGP_4482 [Beggiatoa sp. PS]|nr:hypothetical protein BGP_4482 [Beggiatoa sp. PS]
MTLDFILMDAFLHKIILWFAYVINFFIDFPIIIFFFPYMLKRIFTYRRSNCFQSRPQAFL